MKKLYSDSYDFAPVGYCTLDARGLIQEINLTGAALLGASREYLVDRPIASFVAYEDGNTIRAHLHKCAHQNERVTTEVRFATEGRGPVVAQLVSAPLRGDNGEATGYRTAIVDITTLKQFEARLSFLAEVGDRLAWSLDNRKILRAVASLAVPFMADICLIDMLDESGRCRREEAVFAGQQYGDGRSERTGQFPPEPGSGATQDHVLRSGEGLLVTDLSGAVPPEVAEDDDLQRLVRSTGLVSMIVVPLRAGGAVIGVLTFLSSRSKRRYAADDLVFAQEIARRASMAMDNARLHERAQRAVQAREDLLAVVSHDLRNPLNVILGSADMMLRAPLDDESKIRARRATEAILRSAERMNRLIGDLLDASSIEAGRFSVERAVQAVDPLVLDAIEAVETPASQKGLRVDADVVGDIAVLCDRGRMLQVFSNLIGNAIKFTPRGGAITIRVEPRARDVRFFVSDTGPGIPTDQLPHIFERFWQAKRTARLGTGLGLTIAKGIIEAHGGQIGVESQVGGGSTFFFTLPRGGPSPRKSSSVDAVAGRGVRRSPSSSGRVVLLVDDDEDAREALGATLTERGFDVATAANGEEALQYLLDAPAPAVVVLDLSMPVKDGWEFLVERNQDSGLSSIPVIVLSACEGVEQAVAAANARYVPKPVRTDNLIAAIEHVAR